MSISSIEPLPEPSDDASLYNLRKKLFKAAMNRQWKKVLELYRYKEVQGECITRAKDTLLHVAVSGATENTVLDLLDILEDNREKRCEILSVRNKSGDTPLHLAAALGLEKVCRRIAKMYPDMVTNARNNQFETPLFVAGRHGKKNAFFVLEVAIHKEQNLKVDEEGLLCRDISHCRGYDGNNILHYAINGEQFDLAYEIIRLYPTLMNYVNANGETALHILANNPSVFKSGAHFGLYETIIYYCTITEPLKFQFDHFLENEKKYAREEPSDNREEQSDIQEDENKVLPPTYKVCIDLFSLMKNSISCIFSTVASNLKSTSICKACCTDEENQSAGARKKDDKPEDEYKPSKNQKFPPNYPLTIFVFKIIAKLLSVIGKGKYWRGQTIEKLKQKHGNALQIMEELVDRSTMWEYEEASGGSPPIAYLGEELDHGKFHETPSTGNTKPPPSVGIDQSYYIPNPCKGTTLINAEKEVGIDMEKNSLRIVKEKESTDDILDPGETILINAIKKVGIDMVKILLEKNSLRIVEEKESTHRSDTESPVLVAAKNGITEMVERILTQYPVAIFDRDKDSKNIVLLAVEHRQVHVYDYLRSVSNMESVFWKLDKEGNSALHLAARLSDSRLWSTGAALHIQWEIKWYKYVRSSMGRERSATTNNAGKTPEELFIESHDALIKDGSTELTNICQSCSVVAALLATVAFQSVSTVPGGVDQNSGNPILSKRPVFQLFAISSLLALCFSVTSVVMFLAILISNFKVWDFERKLPVKLILGLTSLFMAIAFTLVAFCAGDFYVIESNVKFAAYPIYAIMCFPVTYFAVAQYPLYINLFQQTIKRIVNPQIMQDYSSY